MSYESEDEKGISKIEYGSRLAACLAYLCLRQTDSVGLTTFDTTVRSMVPPVVEHRIPVKLLTCLVQQ